jgi:arylformamidase
MFVHGGYWRSLEPSMFSHMARGLNARGIAVAVSGYDLSPQVSIAEIIAQTQRACLYLWWRFHKKVMVSGHSAGGHLAACLLATDWTAIASDVPKDLVPSAYAISGLFDLDPLTRRRGTAHLAAVLAGRGGPRIRRRGRRRGIVRVPSPQQDNRGRMGPARGQDAL